jgi:hypothetical protein
MTAFGHIAWFSLRAGAWSQSGAAEIKSAKLDPSWP